MKTLATDLTYTAPSRRGRIFTRARLAQYSFDAHPRFRPVFVTDEEFDQWCMDGLRAGYQDCRRCPLGKGAAAVFGVGDISPTLLVLGGAPSEMDEESGEPFTDHDGVLLRRALKKLGLSLRGTSFLTNQVLCRPPKRRKPNAEERRACTQRLERQIGNLKPWVILLLGREGAHWLGHRTIEDHRGLVPKNEWPNLGRDGKRNLKAIFLTEHPKTVLGAKTERSRVFKAWTRDLKKVAVVCQRVLKIREGRDV